MALRRLGSGTHVTGSFELLRAMPLYTRRFYRWAMGVKDRKRDLEANIRNTLAVLEGAAEKERC